MPNHSMLHGPRRDIIRHRSDLSLRIIRPMRSHNPLRSFLGPLLRPVLFRTIPTSRPPQASRGQLLRLPATSITVICKREMLPFSWHRLVMPLSPMDLARRILSLPSVPARLMPRSRRTSVLCSQIANVCESLALATNAVVERRVVTSSVPSPASQATPSPFLAQCHLSSPTRNQRVRCSSFSPA